MWAIWKQVNNGDLSQFNYELHILYNLFQYVIRQTVHTEYTETNEYSPLIRWNVRQKQNATTLAKN